MKWLDKFFNTKNDKEQAKRTADVDVYVESKKEDFTKTMDEIKRQAQKVHQKTRDAHEQSAKLLVIVDDITAKIDRSTRS